MGVVQVLSCGRVRHARVTSSGDYHQVLRHSLTKSPFSRCFEDAVGQASESPSPRQVARRFGLAESTVRAIDLRYLERWAATRRKPALRQFGDR